MVYIYNGLIFIISTLFFIYIFTLLHEVLHGLGCWFLKIPFKIRLTVFRGYTEVSYNDLDYKNFVFVALCPYFVLFPLFAFMFQLDNIYLMFFGLSGIVWHGLNLPSEFVNYVVGRRRNKENKKDGKKVTYKVA